MSNLHCSGMESTILACEQHPDPYGVLSCSHLQDASVICEGTYLNFSMRYFVTECTCEGTLIAAKLVSLVSCRQYECDFMI